MERLDAACDFDLSHLGSKYSKYFESTFKAYRKSCCLSTLLVSYTASSCFPQVFWKYYILKEKSIFFEKDEATIAFVFIYTKFLEIADILHHLVE